MSIAGATCPNENCQIEKVLGKLSGCMSSTRQFQSNNNYEYLISYSCQNQLSDHPAQSQSACVVQMTAEYRAVSFSF